MRKWRKTKNRGGDPMLRHRGWKILEHLRLCNMQGLKFWRLAEEKMFLWRNSGTAPKEASRNNSKIN